MEYKILSWNVNRLNSPQKRRIFFYWLNKQNAHVVCLQEVHIASKDHKYLINKKIGDEFYALATKKKKGVTFYIKQELNPKLCFQDVNGRFIGVEVVMNFKSTLLVGVYAPNGAKRDFFLGFK